MSRNPYWMVMPLVSSVMLFLEQHAVAKQEPESSPVCGEFSILVASRLLGKEISYSAARSAVGSGEFGADMSRVRDACAQLGLGVVAVSWSPSSLDAFGDTPLIMWLPPTMETRNEAGESKVVGHYVVIRRASHNSVQLINFPMGAPQIVTASDLMAKFPADSGWYPALLIHSSEAESQMWRRGVSAVPASSLTTAESIAMIERVRDNGEKPTISPALSSTTADPSIQLEVVSGESQIVAEIDLGQRYSDEIVTAWIDVKNMLGVDVEVVGMTSDCACTVTDAEGALIAPASTWPVPVKVNLSGKLGSIKQNVSFTLRHDGHQRRVSVSLVGAVVNRWVAVPPAIVWSSVSKASVREIERRVRIQSSQGALTRLPKSARSSVSGQGIMAKVVASSECSDCYDVIVSLTTEQAVIGALRGTIDVYADDLAGSPIMSIPQGGEVVR